MSRLIAALAVACLSACAAPQPMADPDSDAPEARAAGNGPVIETASYAEALKTWRSADEVNAWIGAKFQYDMARALRLSETQRAAGARLPIHAPEAFFAEPRGVCVDLARFGVETLRATEPQSRPAYLMIEFDPLTLAGNTLRRHWVAAFERDGRRYFFADSKRPGFIAGPYATTQAFIDDYARYRGRRIVAFRELETYERRLRTRAPRPAAIERP